MGESEQETRPPETGDPAPDFEAETTQGRIRLEDHRGRWLVLFSHPDDSTPLGTTELTAFAEAYDDLQKRGIELLGLSIDSVRSRIAWVRNVEEKAGAKVPSPIIADLSKEVATKYGMPHEGRSETVTVRYVYIIDSNQVVRATMNVPLSEGGNMREVLRVIDSLQTADQHRVASQTD